MKHFTTTILMALFAVTLFAQGSLHLEAGITRSELPAFDAASSAATPSAHLRYHYRLGQHLGLSALAGWQRPSARIEGLGLQRTHAIISAAYLHAYLPVDTDDASVSLAAGWHAIQFIEGASQPTLSGPSLAWHVQASPRLGLALYYHFMLGGVESFQRFHLLTFTATARLLGS